LVVVGNEGKDKGCRADAEFVLMGKGWVLKPLADGVGDGLWAPYHGTGFDVSDRSCRVDDVGRRQVADAFIDQGGLKVGKMVGACLFGDGDFMHGFVGGEEYDVVIAEYLAGLVEQGHFFEAGLAPGGPEIEDDVFSLEVRDMDFCAIGSEEFPRVDIGLRCTVMFPKEPEA